MIALGSVLLALIADTVSDERPSLDEILRRWKDKGVKRIWSTSEADPTWQWGGAASAGPEPGTMIAWHVTDEPESLFMSLALVPDPSLVLFAPRSSKLEARSSRSRSRSLASRSSQSLMELGPGLYLSAAPLYWIGRSHSKWSFLDRLDDEAFARFVAAVHTSLDELSQGYISSSERTYAERLLEQIASGSMERVAITSLSSQPYNIASWKPEFLAPLGIEPAPTPRAVEFVLRGHFAELEWARMDDELRESLLDAGVDGAFIRSGFSADPQLVLWNPGAIVSARIATL